MRTKQTQEDSMTNQCRIDQMSNGQNVKKTDQQTEGQYDRHVDINVMRVRDCKCLVKIN